MGSLVLLRREHHVPGMVLTASGGAVVAATARTLSARGGPGFAEAAERAEVAEAASMRLHGHFWWRKAACSRRKFAASARRLWPKKFVGVCLNFLSNFAIVLPCNYDAALLRHVDTFTGVR